MIDALLGLAYVNGNLQRQRIPFVIYRVIRCQLGPDGRHLTEVRQNVGIAIRILFIFSAVPAGDLVVGAFFLKIAFAAQRCDSAPDQVERRKRRDDQVEHSAEGFPEKPCHPRQKAVAAAGLFSIRQFFGSEIPAPNIFHVLIGFFQVIDLAEVY